MDLDKLRLFCEVARTRSFSLGARNAGVSQSAASQALAQLEDMLATALIDRSQRPLALTPEGERFHRGVGRVLQGYDRLIAELRKSPGRVSGTVGVAAIYSIGIHAMSQHTQQFMSRYPQARIRLRYLRPDMVVDAVLRKDVDLGILSFPHPTRYLAVLLLREERMALVCHPAHRFAARKVIDLAALDGEGLFAFDRDLAIRQAIDRALRSHGAHAQVLMEFDNVENVKQAVETGAGVAILPEPTVRREVEQGLLRIVPLSSELVRPIGIIYRQGRCLPVVVTAFRDHLVERMGQSP